MGTVIIQEHTTKNPITMIGEQAGICWGADISNKEKNYKRGIECLNNKHGRTFEFPDVYAIIDGYSARVIREWYTHIGGSPTRLQASTRYIDYKDFDYVIPKSIREKSSAERIYKSMMNDIQMHLSALEKMEIPREDIAMGLPLGMCTKITDKRNLRNLIDMSRQRMCNRAYWEYREMFRDYCYALKNYSKEWEYILANYFKPKCEEYGYCEEKFSCGRKGRKGDN